MRAVFTVLGLVVVLAIVGMLAKKQLAAGVAPRSSGSPEVSVPAGATPAAQVQQFRQAAESAVQQPRPMPDDVK